MKIAPSILSADFARLGEECASVMSAGADMLHIDVMDGVFVPNITLGLPVVKSLRKHSDAIFDVHLMIDCPKNYARRFCERGADIITFHLESGGDVSGTIKDVRDCGKKVGIALKPATRVYEIEPFIPYLDMVLIMSVEPGFGGQKFMPTALRKIADLRKLAEKCGNKDLLIEVDGGINAETAKLCKEAGADILVAGSSVFTQTDYRKAIEDLR